MGIYGYVLDIYLDIYGYLWIFMEIYGYLWRFMGIYGYVLDIYRDLWGFVGISDLFIQALVGLMRFYHHSGKHRGGYKQQAQRESHQRE